MRIQNNMTAMNTHRYYNIANSSVASSAEKLSSGYRINRAGDDAAGLAISEKMRAQIRGLGMASKNSSDAISMIQTAEGALQSTHNILQRMRELAVQSATDTNEQVIDRGALQKEFEALAAEIDDTAAKTRFNDQNLIDGTFQKSFFSTNISASKLTSGTVADVSRVQYKAANNVPSNYNINVSYVQETDSIDATAASVDALGRTGIALGTRYANGGAAPTDVSSGLAYAEFEAVAGAKHNGKTFTITASANSAYAQSNQIFTDGKANMTIKITDGDTDYVGVITADNSTENGGKITVDFDGVGRLTLSLGNSVEENGLDKLYNVTSALNGKELKFGIGNAGVQNNPNFEREAVSVSNDVALSFTEGAGMNEVFGEGTGTAKIQYTVTAGVAGAPSFAAATSVIGQDDNGRWQIEDAAGDAVGFSLLVTKRDGTTTTLDIAADKISFDMWDGSEFKLAAGGTAVATIDAGSFGVFKVSFATAAAGTGALDSFQAAFDGLTGAVNLGQVDAVNRLDSLKDLASAAGGGSDTITEIGFAADPGAAEYAGQQVTITTAETGVAFNGDGDLTGANIVFTVGGDAFSIANGNLSINSEWENFPAAGESFGASDRKGTITFDLRGVGKITMDVSGDQADIVADLKLALVASAPAANTGLMINIDAVAGKFGGTDTVEGTDAHIAMELNGETHNLYQNDKSVTFDSTGVSLNFNPLDFEKITDAKTATAQFTSDVDAQAANEVNIGVIKADGKAMTIQTGANQGDELNINIDAMNLQMLGLTDASIATQKSASRAITQVNNAINQVSTQRAALGALQNRLDFKIANLDTSAENLQAAESRIRDVDMAKEMTAFSKKNILVQAATAMLAQANSAPQNVLQLLR